MKDSRALEEQALDEDGSFQGLDTEIDLALAGEPEVFAGEVPPEEELAGAEPESTDVATPPAPDPPPTGDELPEPRTAVPATQLTPDRPIKVVLTLRPGRQPNEPGSAVVAVGIVGHEPTLRYLDSADLAMILAVVPELLAATIEAQRRRDAPGSTGSRPRPVREAPADSGPEPSNAARPQPVPQGRRARGGESSAGQPSLFG